jgi:hypothetical protein
MVLSGALVSARPPSLARSIESLLLLLLLLLMHRASPSRFPRWRLPQIALAAAAACCFAPSSSILHLPIHHPPPTAPPPLRPSVEFPESGDWRDGTTRQEQVTRCSLPQLSVACFYVTSIHSVYVHSSSAGPRWIALGCNRPSPQEMHRSALAAPDKQPPRKSVLVPHPLSVTSS